MLAAVALLAERVRSPRRGQQARSPRRSASSPGHLVLDDAGLLRGVADLRWRLDDLLPHGAHALVVDIHGLTRLSSQTLAALLWAQRRCRLRGGHVRLLGANRRSRELLARTGLTEVFHVLPPDERTD